MKLKTYIPLLTDLSLFKNFSEDDFFNLFNEDNYSIVSYGRKNLIYLQNEICKSFDIILVGTVLIQNIDENGNILSVTSFGIGESLGGNLILSDNNTYPMSVISKNYTTLLKLKQDLVLDLCQKDKNFLIEFIKSISNRSFILGNKLKTITMKTIRQQIIDYLTYQYHKQNSLRIILNMSKKEWSEKLGVHRPSLSRELSKMKREGLIDYDRNSVTIKDVNLINKQI